MFCLRPLDMRLSSHPAGSGASSGWRASAAGSMHSCLFAPGQFSAIIHVKVFLLLDREVRLRQRLTRGRGRKVWVSLRAIRPGENVREPPGPDFVLQFPAAGTHRLAPVWLPLASCCVFGSQVSFVP